MPVFEVRSDAISQLMKRGFTVQIGTISYYFEEEQELTRLGANLIIHPLVEAGNQLVKQILDNDED